MPDIRFIEYRDAGAASIKQSEVQKKGGKIMKMRRKTMAVGLSMALVLGLASCGAANQGASSPSMSAQTNGDLAKSYSAVSFDGAYLSESAMVDYGYEAAESYYDEAGEASYSGGSTGTNANVSSNRKLIRNVSMSVETKEFEAFMASVTEQVNAVGGYIESMDTYNGSRYNQSESARHSNLTVRIPKNQTDGFLTAVSEAGNVTNRSENVEDVTLAYVDMESHKKSLEIEQERLQALLEKAETLEDIITLEDRLSTVRYQLENMESQLRTYDNLVDYSTVRLNIQEVKELTPVIEEEETPGQRLARGFMESLEDVRDGFVEFGIWFVVHIPYLLVWAVIMAIIVVVIKAIIKRISRKNREKREKQMAAWQSRNQEMGNIGSVNSQPAGQQPGQQQPGQSNGNQQSEKQ